MCRGSIGSRRVEERGALLGIGRLRIGPVLQQQVESWLHRVARPRSSARSCRPDRRLAGRRPIPAAPWRPRRLPAAAAYDSAPRPKFVAHGGTRGAQPLQFGGVVFARALDAPMPSAASDPRRPRNSRSSKRAARLQRLGGAHVTQLRGTLQPSLRRRRAARPAIAGEFRGQHIGRRAPGHARRPTAAARAPRAESDATPTPFRYMSPSRYWASAFPAAGGAEQLDRLVELQSTQRRARRLQRILGLGRLRRCRRRGQADDAAECGDRTRVIGGACASCGTVLGFDLDTDRAQEIIRQICRRR